MHKTASKKQKKSSAKGILTIIALLLGGGAVGYILGKTAVFSIPDSPESFYWVWLPMLFLVYFMVIAFHELGHVMAGVWVGFDFKMYVVGPFMWKKELGKISFHWNKNLNLGGGLALCLPKDEHNLIKRFAFFAAGGPLASLALALLGAVPYVILGMHQAQPNFWAFTGSSLLIFLGIFSALIFLVTIIPTRAGGFYSDGARILNLLGGGDKAKMEVVLLHTIAQGAAGIRPRELNRTQLEEALTLNINSPFKLYINSYLYQIYLDLGDAEKAEHYLNTYYDGIENIPAGYRAAVVLDKAFFEAWYKHNPIEAQELYDSANIGAVIPKHQILKTQTAIAFAKGELTKAKELALATQKELSKHMDRGLAAVDQDWLEEVLRQISQKEEVTNEKK